MRIQHNIMAMNAYRNYTSNTSALSKNLEKLSSGYKINRAGDDAAGLAISEKMRAQISGLKQAQANAKSGINLVQTAEGALTEVHDMLNRMVTLADQSANGTYDNDVDRANLQKEVDALKTEINRIAQASNFNGINLLDGSLGSPEVTATDGTTDGTTPAVVAVYDSGTVTRASDNTAGNLTIGGYAFQVDGTTVTELGDQLDAFVTAYNTDAGNTKWTAAVNDAGDGIKFTAKQAGALGTIGATQPASTTQVTAGADEVTGVATAAKTTIDFTGKTGADMFGGTVKINGTTYEFVKEAGDVTATTNTAVVVAEDAKADAIADALATALGSTVGTGTTFDVASPDGKLTLTESGTASGTAKALTAEFSGVGLTLQIGDTSDSFNQLTVSVQSMKTTALGIDTVDVSTQSGAAKAVDVIKNAINTVSSVRGDLGATQNRLDHTINNLSVMTENIQDAEATIRDVDVAEEMMAYTKNNILVQSAQAMLAQANQVPQGVLQLLQ